MSSYTTLVLPRTGTTDYAGRCLPYAQTFFGAPVMYDYARQAFDATQFKHLDWYPPSDAPSLLWFDHWGTYFSYSKGIYEYVNAGHVAILVPGVGIFTSPAYQQFNEFGQAIPSSEVYQTIAEIERIFGATYIGWTEDINGLRVIAPGNKPNPTPPAPPVKKWRKAMETIYRAPENKRQKLPNTDWKAIVFNGEDHTAIHRGPSILDVAVQVNFLGPIDSIVELALRIDTVDDKTGKIVSSRFVISDTREIHKGETKVSISTPVELKAAKTGHSERLRIYGRTYASGIQIAQVRANVFVKS